MRVALIISNASPPGRKLFDGDIPSSAIGWSISTHYCDNVPGDTNLAKIGFVHVSGDGSRWFISSSIDTYPRHALREK
jgi:hypothetical protein